MKIKLTSTFVGDQDKALASYTDQGQSALMFYSYDIQADYEDMKARGADFPMPPAQVTGSTIAMVNDTCGNLIQLAQLSGQG